MNEPGSVVKEAVACRTRISFAANVGSCVVNEQATAVRERVVLWVMLLNVKFRASPFTCMSFACAILNVASADFGELQFSSL